MNSKQVKELMEKDLKLISPDATLVEAAQKMKECGCGFLPVGEKDSPEGIITDRDIVLRSVAEGKDPSQVTVRECMTDDVCCCSETDTLEDAARSMSENNVNRLVVKDKNDRMCGVLTFGRMLRTCDSKNQASTVVEQARRKAG